MKQLLRHLLALLVLLPTLQACTPTSSATRFDVVVYGGTPGGITAAIAAAREGHSVVLIEPTRHVGGMSTSGLNRDEAEHMARDTFGGLADQFFHEAAKRSGANPRSRAKVWQSRVAERVFREMLRDARVFIAFQKQIDSVEMQDTKISVLRSTSGHRFAGRVFIDASYEGDLMAAAGVSHVLGREARSAYDETHGGVIYTDDPVAVDPYDADGKLLFGVMPGKPPQAGSASPHPTAYNIRLNLTTRQDNRVEITQPDSYDPAQHELLARCIEAGIFNSVGQIIGRYGMPGGKVECNNRQAAIVSMAIPGLQTRWAEASFEEREKIHETFRAYTHGLLWFLKTDPRVPEAMRKDMARYGLCKDEWVDNDHWPWQLYVREARRMRGRYVLTQHDITTDRSKEDAIHLGSHFIDSHHTARYATVDGGFINEGRLWQEGQIYQVPYRAITPRQDECDNLLVPVCVSSTHVAFCSLRVEASWMQMGEAAGMAAHLAITNDRPVQSIDVTQLQSRLRELGLPIDLPDDQ